MNYALDQFTMTDGEVLIVQGANSLYTYQNTGNSSALIQGSNDTVHWADIGQIAVGNSLVKEHSYKYLRLVGQTSVDVNRGEGNNSNDGNLVTSVQGQFGDVYLDAEDVNADPVGAAENVKNLLQLQVTELATTKLNAIDYVQHFRGLFSSYAALVAAIPTAINGDYAHIDSGSGFDRMSAIWDGDELPNGAWKIQNVNIGANTDEVPEGSSNLYFTSNRAQQAALLALLTGLDTSIATPALSTDTIKQAIGKLQAQITNSGSSAPVWVELSTVGTVASYVTPYSIQVSRFQGMLWIRGTFNVNTTINVNNELFRITAQAYKPYSYSTAGSARLLQVVSAWGLGGTAAKQLGFSALGNITNSSQASTTDVLFEIKTAGLSTTDGTINIPPTIIGTLVN